MQTYKITWKPLSALSTPLQSDTIFGHLCWAVKYLWEESSLVDLIAILKQRPALVLSSAFPDGKLPKPAIPLKTEVLKQLRANLLKDPELRGLTDLQLNQVLKELKREAWIDLETLLQNECLLDLPLQLQKNARSRALDKLGKGGQLKQKTDNCETMKQSIEFHNKIDRISGTSSGSGELFASNTTFYRNLEFCSWINTDIYSLEQIQELFKFISLHGFGKDKNTGKGRFEIKVEPYSWQQCTNFNAYLNLSNMVPAESDSILASYTAKTKFAKIGGDYASSKTPFKYPVFIIEPGAVFFAGDTRTPPRGMLLRSVHPDPDIVQNLYSFSLPIMVKGS